MASHHALRAQAAALRREGLSLAQIARRLGVAKSVVGRWVADVPFARHAPASLAEQLASRRDPHLYNQALALRRAGWSYSMIAAELGVAKSTLSGWLRDIPVSEYGPDGLRRALAGNRKAVQVKKLQQQQLDAEIQAEAENEIRELLATELDNRELFWIGLALYWAEGQKSQKLISLSNSNPFIVQIFILWLRRYLGVRQEQLRAEVHVYPDLDVEEAEGYWAAICNLPREQFYKAQVDTRRGKLATKQGKLKYGTVHIKVTGQGSSRLHRKVMAWITAFCSHLEETVRE